MTYIVESTDAIHDGDQWSGNYSRVERHTFTMPNDATDREVWRKARELVGLTGCRGRYLYEDAWMPYGSATIVFISSESYSIQRTEDGVCVVRDATPCPFGFRGHLI
jgi:hypothetical protein